MNDEKSNSTSRCPSCGSELRPTTQFPECAECIRRRFQHPGGIAYRHTPEGSRAASRRRPPSYAALDGDKIFDYMAYGPHTEPSGLSLFRSTNPAHRNSVNAVSYRPLGQIPGSGVEPTSGSHYAAQFAVLVDVEGRSLDGPHFMFEEKEKVADRLAKGEWVPCPACSRCGKNQVYTDDSICIACQLDLGLL